MSAAILASLGPVTQVEQSCIVADDDSSVVRGARPLTPEDASKLREQAISRLAFDADAVRSRERRISIERGSALVFRRRA